MSSSLSRAMLASLFAAFALGACSGKSNRNTCSSDNDCGAGTTCKSGECLASGQCPSGILSCVDNASCVSGNICTSGCCAPTEGCATSADCSTDVRPHCDASTHLCVPCANSTQCSTGKVCTSIGSCEPACSSDTNCSTPTGHCLTSGGYCVQCATNAQCPSATPFCTNNICIGCSSNASCAAPTPVCNTATKACVVCLDSQNSNGKNPGCTNTAAPACETGACVACNPASNAGASGANGACPSATPTCSSNSTCVACTSGAQCTSGNACDSASNTCTPVTLVSFTSSAATVVANGTATLTATLNGTVNAPVTINVDSATDGGISGTLSAATIVIASGSSSGTATFTAGGIDGTAVVEAILGSVTLSVPIGVTSGSLAVTSIGLPASPAPAGSAVQATVTLSAAPSADTTVTVSADNSATIGGAASGTATVRAGNATSDPFTVQLACNNSATTITATLGGSSKTALVPITATGNPGVATLTAGSTTGGSGVANTLTVTLTGAAGCNGARVTLASSDLGFNTEAKISSYVPGTITVPAGQTSATVGIVPECTSNTTGDIIYVSAQVPGTPAVGITTPISMTTIAGDAGVFLCPIQPVNADRPLTYPIAGGGTAPMPTMLVAGFFAVPSSSGTGAFSITFNATSPDGGVCGTFSQDGGTLANGKLVLASASKQELTFTPSGVAGPCVLSAQGTSPDGGTTYDAGIVSTLNLVAFDWTQQATPGDLVLNKADIIENTKVGTNNGLSDGGSLFGDGTEYVEIFNPTGAAIDLSAYTLVFVGSAFDNSDGGPAAKNEYWSYALSGMVMPGHYAIAQDANTFDAGPGLTDQLLTFPDAGNAALIAQGLKANSTSSSTGAPAAGNITNASGGIFLVKNAGTATAKIVDGFTYGAPMQQAVSQSITGTAGGIFAWPPAPLLPLDNYVLENAFVKGTMVRLGYTGSPSLDWTHSTTVTPGGPNNVITGP